MRETQTQIGVITFWTLGLSDRAILKNGLDAAGLREFIPLPPTPAVALSGALRELYPEKLIRALSVPGFEVVDVIEGEIKNEYRNVVTCRLEGEKKKSAQLVVYVNDQGLSEFERAATAAKIRAAYARHRDLLNPAALSVVLTKIVREAQQATALRDTGGIYWFGEAGLERWARVAAIVEAAGEKNRVYVNRTLLDADSIRSVRDALINEVTAATKRLNDDVFGGQLGARALEGRRDEARAWMDKVEAYEKILGETLEPLREGLTKAGEAAAAAHMLIETGTADELAAQTSSSPAAA